MLIDLLLAVGRFVDRVLGYGNRERPRWAPLDVDDVAQLRIDAERAEDAWAHQQGLAVVAEPRGDAVYVEPVRLSQHEADELAEQDTLRQTIADHFDVPVDLLPRWCAWHSAMADVPGGVTVVDDAGGHRWCCASCLAQRYVAGDLRSLPVEERRTTVVNEPDCGDECLMGHTYTAACAYSHRWRQKDAPTT